MSLKIGITGGIGSGKSTVARIFASLGYPIYDADSRAKALTVEDPEVVAGIKAAFGEDIYLSDGTPDRKKLAGIVFSDEARLAELNAIIHPATGRDYKNWVKAHAEHEFVFKEAAILFESGSYKLQDAVITIYAPKETRIERVMKRDEVSREQVEGRMENQWPEEKKLERADFVIYNDGNHPLSLQVREAIQFFRAFEPKS